nr:protein translocase subunit SecD [Isoptericola halotolerans]
MVVPFAALLAGIYFDPKSDDNPDGATPTPGLALDLQGGTQIILTPISTDGSEITEEAIDESINVIRQRIDSSGVAEAEIANQGGGNIVVGIPGEVDQATIDLVSQPAQMRFRPVLTYTMGLPADEAAEDEPATEDGADDGAEDAADDGAQDGADDGAEEGSDEAAEEGSAADVDARIAEEATEVDPTDLSDLAQITPAVQEKFDALDCTDPENLIGGGGDDPDLVLVTCANDGSFMKYILGPMEVDGTHVTTASSGLVPGPNGSVTNEWGVFMEMDAEGTADFRDTTQRLQGLEEPRNQFGIVLDGLVISAPSLAPGVIISDGRPQISGNFTRDSAATLANQLSFGSLPIAYEVQSQETISATLGSEQLRNGLIAGLVGMVLVVVYSMFQYRALGLLTVVSLLVAGAITFVAIDLLSWTMGYRLSLAGVAGLIVAIGFVVDSFVVYFERVRDELRDGRSLAMAVERGWKRARRTVLAAKTVNLMSAVILYFISVGGVQGFAFTLGLTTLVDILVVFCFTHPMMQVMTKIPFFRDGHPLSGLSPDRLRGSKGPRYVGAGRFSAPAGAPSTSSPDDPQERQPVLAGSGAKGAAAAAGGRMTIAERRAAARRAERDGIGDDPGVTGEDAPTDSGTNEENR